MITSHQLRAARALLNITAKQLAELSGFGLATIQRMENRGTDKSTLANVAFVKQTLEEQGVEFFDIGMTYETQNLKNTPAKKPLISEGVRFSISTELVKEISDQLITEGIYVFYSSERPDNFTPKRFINLAQRLFSYIFLESEIYLQMDRTENDKEIFCLYLGNRFTKEEAAKYAKNRYALYTSHDDPPKKNPPKRGW